MNKQVVKGYLLAIISAVIYGLMPLMAKHIYADGVNAITLVFLRNFLAIPCLILLTYLKHRTLKVPLSHLPKITAISFFGCCITPVLLFSSYRYIATGTATVFHFIYPSLVVIIGILFLKRKLEKMTLISTVFCFIGVALFYNPSSPINFQGAALSLGSGLTFAIYVLLLSRYKNDRVNGLLLNLYFATISSIITFLMCLATNSLSLPQSLNGWVLCIVFALLVTCIAVFFFQQGAFLIGGEKTSILSVLEPITGMIIGAVAFSESIPINVLIGSVFVLAASILIAVQDLK